MSSSAVLAFAVVALQALIASAMPLEGSTLTRRVVYNCTDSSDQSLAGAAYSNAKTMASSALQTIASNDSDASALRSQYFGIASTAWPIWIYNQIAQESGSNYTLICEPGSSVCGSSTLAHTTYSDTVATNPDGSQTLSNYKAKTELCPAFFDLGDFYSPCIDDDAAAGDALLYHMSFAFGRATTSIGINNCDAAHSLASSNPAAAIHSAENLRCFARAAYKLAPNSICNAGL